MIRAIIITVLSMLSLSDFCFAQNASLIKLTALEALINRKENKVEVINFWATWCGPCVKEIPLFEALHVLRPDVDVVLVSMDMDLDPDPQKVWAFVKRKNISARVYILDERNPNDWIGKIDKGWSGALPATLILNHATQKRIFIERELHEGELDKLIREINN